MRNNWCWPSANPTIDRLRTEVHLLANSDFMYKSVANYRHQSIWNDVARQLQQPPNLRRLPVFCRIQARSPIRECCDEKALDRCSVRIVAPINRGLIRRPKVNRQAALATIQPLRSERSWTFFKKDFDCDVRLKSRCIWSETWAIPKICCRVPQWRPYRLPPPQQLRPHVVRPWLLAHRMAKMTFRLVNSWESRWNVCDWSTWWNSMKPI